MTRCIAPIDGDRLCGAPATTTRIVESLTCALCQEHAEEIDRETMTETLTTIEDDDACTTCGGHGCGDCGNTGLESEARAHGCRRGPAPEPKGPAPIYTLDHDPSIAQWRLMRWGHIAQAWKTVALLDGSAVAFLRRELAIVG
jgi:hypothetical protein